MKLPTCHDLTNSLSILCSYIVLVKNSSVVCTSSPFGFEDGM